LRKKSSLTIKCGHNMLIANPTDLNLVIEIERKFRRFSSSINKKKIKTEMQGK